MNNLIFSNHPPTLIPSNKCKKEKKKMAIKKIKSNTINSLNEVEDFLNEFCKYENLKRLIFIFFF